MKTLIRTLRTALALAALAAALAMPRVASAGTSFTMTTTPVAGSAPLGVATISNSVVGVTATSGYTGGSVTLFSNSIAYGGGASASPGIAVAFTGNPIALVSSSTVNGGVTVTTTSGTLAGTYTVTIIGTNTSAKSATNTYTLTVGSIVAAGPGIVWTNAGNAGANTNWSTTGNWAPNHAPVVTNDVQFFDTGAVGTAGTVNNVVDSNFNIGSLNYGQTNNVHTTLIASGVTLSVTGTNGLSAGTRADNGALVLTNTITGAAGALIVSNTGALVNITQANPSGSPSMAQAALDMSGLASFKGTISRLLVGVDSALKGNNGVLNLARTNIITMTSGSASPQIDVGDNSQASGVTGAALNILLLGQTNAFYVDSIEVGRSRTTNSTMLFNSAFSSPKAYFRGTNGNVSPTNRVGNWYIGDGGVGKVTGFFCNGTNDFSLGTVDALVDTMYIGVGSSATGTGGSVSASAVGQGTLIFNAGTVDVNTLEVGYTVAAVGNGTVNVNGGTLVVNTLLELAHGTNVLGSSSGTLNISSATVTANNGISADIGTSTIHLTSSALNCTNNTATVGTSNNPVSFFATTNSTMTLAIQYGTPSVATTNLAVGGTANTINISSVPILTGFPAQFQVIQYGINGGSASGDLTTVHRGTLPTATPAYGAYLSNNVANNSIDIVFTNGPTTPALTWDGTPSGNWNISSTANWRPTSGPDTVYVDTAFVTFNDTLTGTANVTLTTTLAPGSVTVNNPATNYNFSGTGRISGTTGLSKQGAGTLVLDNSGSNDFTGGVNITAGTLQVGNNDSNGNLPLGPVTDNGVLVFNRADNLMVLNTFSGAGTITQNNPSVLTLSGDDTDFSGAITVAQGTLQAGNTNVLGAATGVAVSNGATLDVNGQALFGDGSVPPVTISGAGVGGNGAIVNNSTNDQTKVLHIVTLAADATFGGTADWDIRNTSGGSQPANAQLNGAFNLTKVGTNQVTLRGVTIDSGLLDMNVQGGTLAITATASAPLTTLGDSSRTATVFSNATLTLDTIGTIPTKNFVLTNGGTLRCSGTNTLGSPVTLTGAANNTISVGSDAQFTITSAISGVGSLSKNGSSTLFLTANNTYTGSTVVSGGTLALYGGGDGSIASSASININSGAILDVSGQSDGTFTLTSGQTLIGGAYDTNVPAIPGMIYGSLVVSAGAIIAPGTGTNNVGTISASTNVTLHGATVMKISATNGNDQIAAFSLTNGGTLVVTNVAGTLTNGQTFQLFVATNGIYNAGTFSSVTLPSAAGLTWTNKLAVNGTLTAGVAGSGTPAQPHITSVSLSGTSLVISGTNGTAGSPYAVLTSTNVALPFSQWIPIVTNTFTSGNFSVTNTVNPAVPRNFYLLRVP